MTDTIQEGVTNADLVEETVPDTAEAAAGVVVDVVPAGSQSENEGGQEVAAEVQVGQKEGEQAGGAAEVEALAPAAPPVYYSLEFYNNRTGVERSLINVAAESEEHARQIADERCPPEFRIVPPGARVGYGAKAVAPGEDSLRVRRQEGVEALVSDYSFKGMPRGSR